MIATILQLETEGHLRRRVMSLYTVTIIGLGPLGSLISGSLATIMPVPLAISIPALIIICLVCAVTRPAWQGVR
jgi:ABC-type transport system involved in multi-copper enzyme maturation permease subunit